MPEWLLFDPTFAEVREHEPLVPVRLPYGEPALMVTRYDDVRIVQSDPQFADITGQPLEQLASP